MNFRKIASVLALLMTASLMGGCNNSQSSAQPESTLEIQVQDQIYTVKVESIDNQTITAVQGELVQAGPPALPEGESPTGEMPPALPEGTDNTAPEKPEGTDNAVPAKPEGQTDSTSSTQPGEASGDMPAAPPEGMSAGGTSFQAIEEKLSFTVTDSTEITLEMLQGTQEGTLDSIGVNDVLEVTLNEDGTAKSIVVKNLQAGGNFGGSGEVTQGTSANTIDADTILDGQSYTSTGDDENALRIDGAKVTLNDLIVDKLQGESSNTEDGDFYGQNAALLATNGAEVNISNATVNTAVTNGNGIFSYGEGTVVNISDSTINTSGSNSGGIQTTGGATMNASNLTVETKGNSAAAIRSDRGGGTVKVTGGSYTSNGTGSPAIYSTAEIHVSDATLTANQSEALVIEGKNSIDLENCDVTGNMAGSHLEANDNIHNIMIYQSMSGDAAVGHSTFTAKGGSITSKQGDMIYITNTTCTVDLTNVKLTLANGVILNVAGNTSSRGWGTQGSNGGDCTLVTAQQNLDGQIKVDDISSLDMTMNDSTVFNGTINAENTAGRVKVTMDASSQWTLTGDSYISEFNGSLSQVNTNGFKLYVNGQEAK